MPEANAATTMEQRVSKLAEWSSRFRNGYAEMVEQGEIEPEELDEMIGEEEKDFQDRQEARKKALKTRKLVRKF